MTVREFKQEFEKYRREDGAFISSEWENNVVKRAVKDPKFTVSKASYHLGLSSRVIAIDDSLDEAMNAIRKILEVRDYDSRITIHITVSRKLTKEAMKLPLENVIDIRQTLIMPEDLAKILTPELAEKYMWQKTSTIWGFK